MPGSKRDRSMYMRAYRKRVRERAPRVQYAYSIELPETLVTQRGLVTEGLARSTYGAATVALRRHRAQIAGQSFILTVAHAPGRVG